MSSMKLCLEKKLSKAMKRVCEMTDEQGDGELEEQKTVLERRWSSQEKITKNYF